MQKHSLRRCTLYSDLTIVTVTWNTWETYTKRLMETFFHYVDPSTYYEWIMVDNDSEDADEISDAMVKIPVAHRNKFTLARSDQNIQDLPQYNRVLRDFVQTPFVICLSTDVRIFKGTIPYIMTLLQSYDMVGTSGPSLPKGAEDPKIGGNWHWVPSLLVAREIDFDTTTHVQTHCFGVRRQAFLDVGGFWEPADGNFSDKGNLIAGEMSLSIRLRRADYKLGLKKMPFYHYGCKLGESMDDFDRGAGWPLDFPRIFTEEEDA